jgi:hypothetical protein
MTRRNTSDPLLKAFLETYQLNLLAIPRRDAQVGDMYVESGNGTVSMPGSIQSYLVPEPKLPRPRTGETMAKKILTKQTRALKLKIGLGLLESFFKAIGATIALGKIKAAYEKNGASMVRFQLKNVTRDSIDPGAFGKALIPCRLNKKHPFVRDGNRYYVTVGVVRSPSITVTAEGSDATDVSVEAEAVKGAVSAKGKLSVKTEAEALAFGVELVELAYDENERRFLMSGMDRAIAIRGKKAKPKKMFIGDPVEGDVFVRVSRWRSTPPQPRVRARPRGRTGRA